MADLPKAIAAYFDLQPDSDPVLLAEMFAQDAAVLDEKEDHVGLSAVQLWRRQVMERTPSTARPVSVATVDGRTVVSAEVSGSFAGSPVTLDHYFTMRDGLIATLEIK